MDVRPADATDLDQLARVWFDGWHEAHAHLAPPEVTKHRTFDSFRARLPSLLADTRVIGPPGAPTGFCIIYGDELYQLFVAPESRGTGAAAALIGDAERRLAKNGVATAWLSCAIGNHRAARFYEKQGWHMARVMVYDAQIENGSFPIEVWRYEKLLASTSRREPNPLPRE